MAELPERTVERDQGAERPGWFLQKGRTLHAEIPWEGPEVTVCQHKYMLHNHWLYSLCCYTTPVTNLFYN